MKKLYVFLLLLLAIILKVNGQGPIQPYKENGYSILEFESFSMSGGNLANSWRNEMLAIINNGLRSAGKNLTLDERHISWIFDHISYEVVKDLKIKENSKRSAGGTSVKFFPEDDLFSGEVGVFEYEGVRIILFKTICMNLLKVVVQTSPLLSPKIPEENPVFIKEKEESSSFVLPKNMSTLASMPVPYDQPAPISIPVSKFNWKPVIIIGGATLVVGTGFLVYSLLKKANGGGPIDAPPVGGDEGGPQDGQPVGP